MVCEELFVKMLDDTEMKCKNNKNHILGKTPLAATSSSATSSSATSSSATSSSATAAAATRLDGDNSKVRGKTGCEVWGFLTALAKEYMDRAKTTDGDRAKTTDGDRAKTNGGDRAKTTDGDRAKTNEGDRAKTTDGDRAKTNGGDRSETAVGDRAETADEDWAKPTDEGEKEISPKNRGVFQCLSKACVLECEMYRIATEIKQVSPCRLIRNAIPY